MRRVRRVIRARHYAAVRLVDCVRESLAIQIAALVQLLTFRPAGLVVALPRLDIARANYSLGHARLALTLSNPKLPRFKLFSDRAEFLFNAIEDFGVSEVYPAELPARFFMTIEEMRADARAIVEHEQRALGLR